jgi:hypothetical protein
MLFATLGVKEGEVQILRSPNPDLLAQLFKQLNTIDLRRKEDGEVVHGILGEIARQVESIEEVR